MEGFRRRLPILVGTLLILAGCVVKLYPSVCSLYRDCIAGEAIEKYRQDISRISEQEKSRAKRKRKNITAYLLTKLFTWERRKTARIKQSTKTCWHPQRQWRIWKFRL